MKTQPNPFGSTVHLHGARSKTEKLYATMEENQRWAKAEEFENVCVNSRNDVLGLVTVTRIRQSQKIVFNVRHVRSVVMWAVFNL